MGWWDYKNIGASASRQNLKYVEKLFDYMGYCPDPDYAPDGDECSFREPDVYCCMSSVNPYYSDRIRWVKELDAYGVKDLRNLLNALFPGTFIYIHSASGNNTSDTWENHDEVYNTDDMTCYGFDTYTDYGGGTYQPDRSWKARFILEAPPMAYVKALIQISKDDGYEELTELLMELARRLRDKEIVYEDDGSDTRKVNKKYDIVKGEEARSQITIDYGSSEIIFGRYYFGTKRQIQQQYEAQMAKYKEYKERFAHVLASDSFDEYLRRSMEKARIGTTELIALRTDIIFDGKRFAVDPGFPFSPEMTEEIRIRGGLFNSSGVVRKTDYYVVDLELRGEYSQNTLEYAQEVQRLGFGLQIITEYQLWEALFDETKPVLTEEELEDRRVQAEAQRRAEEEERQRKKKEAEEAKERRKAERQQREEEKQRLAIERQQEREKRQALRIQQQQEEARRKESAILERQQQREQEKLLREKAARENEERRRIERQQALANADIKYTPGQEPEAIRRRLDILFPKLDATYPDRVISGLYKDHKKWGETVTELYRLLGYPDGTSMLEAYGYTVRENKGGRTVSVDPVSIMEELHRRYPNGAGPINLSRLSADNPDIPWKTLSNNAAEYFGKTLVAHLKAEGIIGGAEIYAPLKAEDQQQLQAETVDVLAPKVEQSESDVSTTAVSKLDTDTQDLVETPSSVIDEPKDVSFDEVRSLGLTEGDKRYLEAIIQLSKEHSDIKAVDIAAFLSVSKPSVSVALKRLCDKDYIYIDMNKSIHVLDEAGEANLSRQEVPTIESVLAVQLSDSEKKYIWAIEQLQKEYGFVRSVDVANKLGVSKPSVSIALKKLKEKGVVLLQPNGSLSIVTADPKPMSSAAVNTSTDIEAHREAEEKARREAEEQARREAEEKARREAEEQSRREAEEKARREAEEKARREAEEQARREAEEQARREAEEQARREAEEKARREAEEQARRDAEEKARREAEKQARHEAEEKSRQEAEEKERRATKERAKQEAEKKARQDAEETQRRAAEAQRIAEKARISAEILDLTNEMNSLKGLFVGMKRKKLQARINELNDQLRRL